MTGLIEHRRMGCRDLVGDLWARVTNDLDGASLWNLFLLPPGSPLSFRLGLAFLYYSIALSSFFCFNVPLKLLLFFLLLLNFIFVFFIFIFYSKDFYWSLVLFLFFILFCFFFFIPSFIQSFIHLIMWFAFIF